MSQNPIGAHQLAHRAAILWCGSESGNRHGPPRPACRFPTEPSDRKLDHHLATDRHQGRDWICSYYDEIRALDDAPYAALHGADPLSSGELTAQHKITMEPVLLEVLS